MKDSAEISVHDNFLVSYEALCERREIVFHVGLTRSHRVTGSGSLRVLCVSV